VESYILEANLNGWNAVRGRRIRGVKREADSNIRNDINFSEINHKEIRTLVFPPLYRIALIYLRIRKWQKMIIDCDHKW
jgi:hypothetical protein